MGSVFGVGSSGAYTNWEKVREQRDLQEKMNVSDGSKIGFTPSENGSNQSAAASSNVGTYGSDSVDFGIFSTKTTGVDGSQGIGQVSGGAAVGKTATSDPTRATSGLVSPENFNWKDLERLERELVPVCDAEHQWMG